MNGDVIALGYQFFQCSLYQRKRTDAKRLPMSGRGHSDDVMPKSRTAFATSTNGTQTDDADGFSRDFGTDELLLQQASTAFSTFSLPARVCTH